MCRFVFSLTVAIFTLLFVSSGPAQQTLNTSFPNLIRYGGTLPDAQGAPMASATMGVTFALYKQQEGGAPVWMETQNVTTDASGNYSVLLGSATVTGLPSDLFSQQEQRWLGVQVQGEAEQPRVLLVSVPYAFKAHDAETLGGKSVSDFVLANDASSSANSSNSSPAVTSTAQNLGSIKSGTKAQALSQGPTNFSGSTSDQIVKVTQSGTGAGVLASTTSASTSYAVLGTISGPGAAIFGQASSTSAQAYGVQGNTSSTIGIGALGFATSTTGSTYGVKGYSSSTNGTGVRGLSTATTGYTTGISASVASPAGTAAVFNNAAGGKIISGQNNGVEEFSVDGSGTLRASSLLGAGIVDGQAPVTITTAASCTLGTASGCAPIAYNSGYTFNEEATTGQAVTYTLPTAAAGKQYCVSNAYNGSTADTGTLTIQTSASGQYIIFTDGTLSASDGYVISGGAALDAACVVGVDSTHWILYVERGTWTKH